ncbi:MAG: hypothetical protein Q9185_000740 [Variospora sp. 1 TL-2023]
MAWPLSEVLSKHTGIGGLTLGGGYDWLSGQYGLTIDQLLSVEMVLANGQIITTSASEKPDLFWAIRGAGQSFGVATSFTFRAHEQKDPVFASTMTFTPDKIPAAVALANRLAEARQRESRLLSQPKLMSVIFHSGPASRSRSLLHTLLRPGTRHEYRGHDPLPPPQRHAQTPVAGPGGRKFTKGASFIPPMRAEFYALPLRQLRRLRPGGPRRQRLAASLSNSLTRTRSARRANRGMAFASRDFYGNVMAGPRWHDEANDGRCRQWARDVADLLRRETEPAKIAGAGQSWKWQAWAGMGIMKGRMRRIGVTYESASPTLPLQSRWMVSFY